MTLLHEHCVSLRPRLVLTVLLSYVYIALQVSYTAHIARLYSVTCFCDFVHCSARLGVDDGKSRGNGEFDECRD